MFKFIFEIATEPLGLPIEWYYEWLILAIINAIAFELAWGDVRGMYRRRDITGKTAGSFFHWIIRTLCFVAIWAVTYGVICIAKFVWRHKLEVGIGIGCLIVLVLIVKMIIVKKTHTRIKVNEEDMM